MFIFEPLFTIFSLLMGGYLAKRIYILKQKQARTFLDFVVVFALPCLIFDRSYHLNFDFSLVIYIALGLSSSFLAALFSAVLGLIFNFSRATCVSIFLLSCFGNTIFIGLPIISALYPNQMQFVGEVILYDAFATALPISLLGPFVISLASQNKINFIKIIQKIVIFPPFIALVLGFLCKTIDIVEFIFSPIRLFGDTATPLALFAIGLSISFKAIKSSYKATIIVVVAKTLITPFIFIVFLKLLNLEFTKSAIVAIFESSVPTMMLASAMIIKAKLDANLAVSVIIFGVIFSFMSMPILAFILI